MPLNKINIIYILKTSIHTYFNICYHHQNLSFIDIFYFIDLNLFENQLNISF